MYTEHGNYELGKGRVLGELFISEEFGTDIPAVYNGNIIPNRYNFRLLDEDDRIEIQTTFEKGQVAMLVLENDKEKHQYFVPTSNTSISLKAMCVGTFLSKDSREIRKTVTKQGLKGEFKLFMIIDEEKFKTDIIINC